MTVAWMQLAQLEREAGDKAAAVDSMQKAVSLSPGNTEPLALLAAYLTEAGRAREAADLLALAARELDADPDLLSTQALALARLGAIDEALVMLARARERDPTNAMLLVHVGTVQLTADRRSAAREVFAEAVRLNPDVARAQSSLGVLALEDGRPAEAAEHWRTATASICARTTRSCRSASASRELDGRSRRAPASSFLPRTRPRRDTRRTSSVRAPG